MAGASDILLEIAAKTRERIEEKQKEKPLAQIRVEAEKIRAEELAAAGMEPDGTDTAAAGAGKPAAHRKSFIEALKKPGMSYICEVKKASPSKGLIAEDFPYLEIAKEYEAAGASAISCLTEPFYFKGSDRYLREITDAVDIPVLRKDFTVSEYMIYEAKILGASAVLLICSLLDDVQLKGYMEVAKNLGMDALVEAHDSDEVFRAIAAGAEIIGVNNRDLRTFKVDMGNSIALRSLAPADTVFVSESGIRTSDDIGRLRDNDVDAVLIGETLMRRQDKKAALEELNGGPVSKLARSFEAIPEESAADRQAGISEACPERPKIKICGLSRPEDIKYVNAAKPDYAGFVIDYPKSHRSITPDQLREFVKALDDDITPVGVFVDAGEELAADLYNSGVIKIMQLHGNEDDEYIARLRTLIGTGTGVNADVNDGTGGDGDEVRIVKAFRVRTPEDLEKAQASIADMVLLDQGKGEGRSFDWSIVRENRDKLQRPFFLAGGLDAGNLAEAVELMHPWAVDMSSSLETDKVKDREKIDEIMKIMDELQKQGEE